MSFVNPNPTILAVRTQQSTSGWQDDRVSLIAGPVAVDGSNWYQVQCRIGAIQWIKTQDRDLWCEVIDARGYIYTSVVDVSERLYLLLTLKYSIS